MRKQDIDYNRAPSRELLALLKPEELKLEELKLEGFLEPVLDLERKKSKNSSFDLEVQFGSGDVIRVYRGLAKVVELERLDNCKVKISANPVYMEQKCGEKLFGDWTPTKSGFEHALLHYLRHVTVDPKYTEKEGNIQKAWSDISEIWTPFDRESSLEYKSTKYRKEARESEPEVTKAFGRLKKIWKCSKGKNKNKQWARPKRKDTGRVDRLAVDANGRLVLIEVKDAECGKPDEVYYSPFQMLQYVWEWKNGLEKVPTLLNQIQCLLDARVYLGLIEPPKFKLTGNIRAAVCFGNDGRSSKVKRRYGQVMAIVNCHLPLNVKPIETWMIDDNGRPQRINCPKFVLRTGNRSNMHPNGNTRNPA